MPISGRVDNIIGSDRWGYDRSYDEKRVSYSPLSTISTGSSSKYIPHSESTMTQSTSSMNNGETKAVETKLNEDETKSSEAEKDRKIEGLMRGVEIKYKYSQGLLEYNSLQFRDSIMSFTKAITLSRGHESSETRAHLYMRRSQAKYRFLIDLKESVSAATRQRLLESALRDCERACCLDLQNPTDAGAKMRFFSAHLLFHLWRLPEALSELQLLQESQPDTVTMQSIEELRDSIIKATYDPMYEHMRQRLPGSTFNSEESPPTSDGELEEQEKSRTVMRYKGHSHNETAKAITFWGNRSQFVMSGSDDDRILIWKTSTGKLVSILDASSIIIDVIEPHPTDPVLATTGMGGVQIWEPADGERKNWATLRTKVNEIINKNMRVNDDNTTQHVLTRSELRGIMGQQENRCVSQ